MKLLIHHLYAPEDGELPPENHDAFMVENVEAACQQLMEQGLTPEISPQEFYWGRSAYLRDPDGHQSGIIQMEKSHAG